jgi:hypothetical protein
VIALEFHTGTPEQVAERQTTAECQTKQNKKATTKILLQF